MDGRSAWMALPAASFLVVLSPARWASAQDTPPVTPAVDFVLGEHVEAGLPWAFEGFVLEPSGRPAQGAVVVSSAGGRAVTDHSGHYLLEAQVASEADTVQITAVGRAGTNLLASAPVGLSAGSRLAMVGILTLVQGSTCEPSWLPTFGAQPGTNESITALCVFDDGSGPALYAGGLFTRAGSADANRIARWNGSTWTRLTIGMNGPVHALTVFDDGSGPALYAGGSFTRAGIVTVNRIAKWDGSSWTPLGSGMTGDVYALVAFDDGSGPALFAGGSFTSAGGVATDRVARWDGSSWTPLGSGMTGDVYALTAFDDGSGPALFAGGYFTAAGGVAANRIARWNGSSWAALGSGVTGGVSASVRALTVHDDGSGPALFVGGNFTNAGGAAASHVASWDGSSWSALGTLGPFASTTTSALATYDDGSGPALYAGGTFTIAGGSSVQRIAKWNGSTWSALGGGVSSTVLALSAHDDGSGPALFVGGDFVFADGKRVTRIAKWQGSNWSALGAGLNGPSTVNVHALVEHDDGSGPALYAGGDFDTVDGIEANGIAKWDGVTWSPLAGGLDEGVYALTAFDDGSGPALYAGGVFVGGNFAYFAKWNGSDWGTFGLEHNNQISALTVFDDGNGPALYAGGAFTYAGGPGRNRIARWNGSNSWSALGSGLNGSVSALTVFDDGSGPELYAGGYFTAAGAWPANGIAKWNGSRWTNLGSGLNGAVLALTVYDDGNGPALYAGGDFTFPSLVARWNGQNWTGVGGGLGGLAARALRVHDDGDGPALYVGGTFTNLGGMASTGIAKWDGTSWEPLGSGVVGGGVYSLGVFDGPDDGGPALVAGGSFRRVPGSGDGHLALWGCDATPPSLACPESLVVLDAPGSPPGEVVTFSVTATDDHDPSPSVVCVPPSGSLFARGTTLVTCTATDASGNRSTCQFPIQVAIKRTRRR